MAIEDDVFKIIFLLVINDMFFLRLACCIMQLHLPAEKIYEWDFPKTDS